MIKRFFSLALVTAAVALVTATSWAADPKPFNAAEFKKAQTEGKTVLVDFHATWCPTCKAQKPVIEAVLKEQKFSEVVTFVADYDTEVELKKQMKISAQATLVVFKGDKETARATGVTAKDKISALLAKGL